MRIGGPCTLTSGYLVKLYALRIPRKIGSTAICTYCSTSIEHLSGLLSFAGFLIALATTIAGAQSNDWFSVPNDKGALILVVPEVTSNRTIVVRDEAGKLLDFSDAKTEKPFLRQYQLAPGAYSVQLMGLGNADLIIEPGAVSTIAITADGVDVTDGTTDVVRAIQKELADAGGYLHPIIISPTKNKLQFSAESPSSWGRP